MKIASLPPLPTNQESLPTLISQLRGLIEAARGQALRAVDSIQVRTCWEIGQHIVEFEQQGADRAAYGIRLIPKLAESLTAEFGKGFDERNLRHMRTFFQDFPIWNAVRTELSWTHYRTSVVRYSVLHENEQLFASKYKLVLPSEDELRAELEKEQLWLAEQGKAGKCATELK